MFKTKVFSKIIYSFITLLLVISTHTALAETTTKNGSISFSKPWVRALPPMVMTTAAYVEIHNSSNENDTLLSVSSPAINMMSVHQTKAVDGLLKMLETENVIIPAMGKLALAPGGYHMMLMGMKKPLTENDTIIINFEFKKAGTVQLSFPVRKK